MTKFRVGDTVRCMVPVTFMYGEKHVFGQILTVTAETVDYFNYFPHEYEQVCPVE